VAIGDGMGAPVEGWAPEKIQQCFGKHDLKTFLPPTHAGDPARGKGDGRITDDTLMTEALLRAYQKAGTHLDAYGYEEYLLPEISVVKTWVPERCSELPIFERLWWPERFPWMRLMWAHADPRQAGVGNCVNCGVAMWMMPVGAMNAGDPRGAYTEATALGLAHNESFAVESAGVMAACYAAALGAGATLADVLVATALGRDATGKAIAAAVAAAERATTLKNFVRMVRAAIAPFAQNVFHVADDVPSAGRSAASDVGKPSRLTTIEELPVAVAALVYGAGDFHKTLRAGVFYGRDCDSIAGMACGLFGALHGIESLPRTLRMASDEANRREFNAQAAAFVPIAEKVLLDDTQRLTKRKVSVH
jgi:ADP-ribosylglycohydrolase